MSRGRRKGSDPIEQWSPGRTLGTIFSKRLTDHHILSAMELLGILDEPRRSELAGCLQSIASRYAEQARDAERPPAAWYRSRIGSVQEHAEAILEELRMSEGTAFAQLKVTTRRIMKRPLRHDGSENLSVEGLLEDLVEACKSCTYRTVRGAPKKIAVKSAVLALRDLWAHFKGENMPMTLERADGRKDHAGQRAAGQPRNDYFIADGPRFVQAIMRMIDPSVEIGAITTALRGRSLKVTWNNSLSSSCILT